MILCRLLSIFNINDFWSFGLCDVHFARSSVVDFTLCHCGIWWIIDHVTIEWTGDIMGWCIHTLTMKQSMSDNSKPHYRKPRAALAVLCFWFYVRSDWVGEHVYNMNCKKWYYEKLIVHKHRLCRTSPTLLNHTVK